MISWHLNKANYARGWGFCFVFPTRGPEFCTEKLSLGRGFWWEKLVAQQSARGGMVTGQIDTCINSVPFIKKTLVNQVYIRIWSFWLTFTVFQWMKENSKNSQFSSFLLRSRYAIHVKIWKWLKLLNSYPFTKKTLVNQLYIRIWSFWLTFTVLQWMKKNNKK